MKHIAIIMDGNGRWAKQRNLPRKAGHRQGAEAAKKVLEAAAKAKVRYLTLYTFSSENWQRPEEEVNDLMGLLRWQLANELEKLNKNNIRVKIIGDRERLAPDIRKGLEKAEEQTRDNTAITVVLALSYGGRQEILHAAEKAGGKALDEATFASYLYTQGIPDPDLLIRTGGEKRLSNFLLWQCAYSELYFTDVLWPDFGERELEEAMYDYERRERRFGKISD